MTVPITRSLVSGKFTITSANVTAGANIIEVQHRCTTTAAGMGYGVAADLGVVEVYTVVEMWRVD